MNHSDRLNGICWTKRKQKKNSWISLALTFLSVSSHVHRYQQVKCWKKNKIRLEAVLTVQCILMEIYRRKNISLLEVIITISCVHSSLSCVTRARCFRVINQSIMDNIFTYNLMSVSLCFFFFFWIQGQSMKRNEIGDRTITKNEITSDVNNWIATICYDVSLMCDFQLTRFLLNLSVCSFCRFVFMEWFISISETSDVYVHITESFIYLFTLKPVSQLPLYFNFMLYVPWRVHTIWTTATTVKCEIFFLPIFNMTIHCAVNKSLE